MNMPDGPIELPGPGVKPCGIVRVSLRNKETGEPEPHYFTASRVEIVTHGENTPCPTFVALPNGDWHDQTRKVEK